MKGLFLLSQPPTPTPKGRGKMFVKVSIRSSVDEQQCALRGAETHVLLWVLGPHSTRLLGHKAWRDLEGDTKTLHLASGKGTVFRRQAELLA